MSEELGCLYSFADESVLFVSGLEEIFLVLIVLKFMWVSFWERGDLRKFGCFLGMKI